ncbi:MAG: WG repeat-containing protein [Bacteroidia bacterium]|nr:WG repeat-containing protein [Bacteroidia bacterium]
MKKILLLAAIVLATTTTYAQNIQKGGEGSSLYLEKDGKKIVKEKFDRIEDYNSKANLIPAKLKGKWGFYDNDGKLVIPHQYEGMVFEYSYTWYTGGLMQVVLNGNKIFIDKTGNEVQSAINYFSYLGVEGEDRYYAARDKNGSSALANEEKILTAPEYLVLQKASKNPITFNAVRKSDNKVMKLDANGQEIGEAESTSSNDNSNTNTDDKKAEKCNYKCKYNCGKTAQGNCNENATGITNENCPARNPNYPKQGNAQYHSWVKIK